MVSLSHSSTDGLPVLPIDEAAAAAAAELSLVAGDGTPQLTHVPAPLAEVAVELPEGVLKPFHGHSFAARFAADNDADVSTGMTKPSVCLTAGCHC